MMKIKSEIEFIHSFIHLDTRREKKPRIRTRKHILIFNLLSILFLILILRFGWMFQVQFKQKKISSRQTHIVICVIFFLVFENQN